MAISVGKSGVHMPLRRPNAMWFEEFEAATSMGTGGEQIIPN